MYVKLNYGKAVEKRVRQSGHSVTKLASLINVNRRSIYNWFNQEYLDSYIIHRIGSAINYNFSIDFPELFSNAEVTPAKLDNKQPQVKLPAEEVAQAPVPKIEEDYWKEKYVILLKKYCELVTLETDKLNKDTP